MEKGALIIFTPEPFTVLVIDNVKQGTEYWQTDFLSVEPVKNEYHQTHQFLGIAKEFVNRLEQWCRDRNASAMMLEVKVDNIEAIGLYVALGYQKISIRMDYFGPGLDAQVMRKELS